MDDTRATTLQMLSAASAPLRLRENLFDQARYHGKKKAGAITGSGFERPARSD
jgi:hypothetical protein